MQRGNLYSSVGEPSTLSPGLTSLIRNVILKFPFPVIRSGGRLLRRLTASSLAADGRFAHRTNIFPELGVQVDEVFFGATDGERSGFSEDFLVYLHGGGYNMCDSGDFLVASSLLPMLSKALSGHGRAVMYSVVYSLSSLDGSGHFSTVCAELRRAWDAINELRRDGRGGACLAIMGDSAGGHAALNLAQQLQHTGPKMVPPLVLISPWVDLFADNANANESSKGYQDMLCPRWVRQSAELFLGPRVRRPIDAGLLFVGTTGQRCGNQDLAEKLATLLSACGCGCLCIGEPVVMPGISGSGSGSGSGSDSDSGSLFSAESGISELVSACRSRGLHIAVAVPSSSSSSSKSNSSHISSQWPLLVPTTATTGTESAMAVVQAAVRHFPGIRQEDCLLVVGGLAGGRREARQHGEGMGMGASLWRYLDLDSDPHNAAQQGCVQKEAHWQTDVDLGRILLAVHSLLSASGDDKFAASLASAVDQAAVSLAFPSLAPEGTLARLPPLLIFAGERELLLKQIEDFSSRAAAAGAGASAGGVTLIKAPDIHAYAIHGRHPLRLTLGAMKATWLFECLYPSRAACFRATGFDSAQCAEAYTAMVSFLLSKKTRLASMTLEAEAEVGPGTRTRTGIIGIEAIAGGGGRGGVPVSTFASPQDVRRAEKILPSNIPAYSPHSPQALEDKKKM